MGIFDRFKKKPEDHKENDKVLTAKPLEKEAPKPAQAAAQDVPPPASKPSVKDIPQPAPEPPVDIVPQPVPEQPKEDVPKPTPKPPKTTPEPAKSILQPTPEPEPETLTPAERQQIIDKAFDQLQEFQSSYSAWVYYCFNKDRRPDGTLHFSMTITPEERQLEAEKNRGKWNLLDSIRELAEIPEPKELGIMAENFAFLDSSYSHELDIAAKRHKDLYDLKEAAGQALEEARNKQKLLFPEMDDAENQSDIPILPTVKEPDIILPETSEELPSDEMFSSTDSLSESISISMSKLSVDEDEEAADKPGLIIGEDTESISNEVIGKKAQVLKTYEVLTNAIKGGMGSVWKVHHNSWNVELAMKRPQPKFFAEGSQSRKENFIRECDSWIKLGLHPNIVSCYYVREIGGVPTIFSEWMENGSLENRIEDKTLYEGTDDEVRARLLDIAIQFARGLHYAHESEDHLIHQDVKPDNLLLTKEWDAKVADFGLARARIELQQTSPEETAAEGSDGSAIPSEYSETENEISAGATHMAPTGGYTPAYCSEEQMLGETLTRRTDIYSWAVSVLEMYLGERPWKSGVDAGRECANYFASCRVEMPEGLKELLTKCLKEDPEERPHDFAAIEDALKRIYREVCGKDYPRKTPEAAADTADSLNNRALSYLDLGKTEEAEQFWEAALEKTPDHLRSLYNQGLYQWRNCSIDDEEFLRRLRATGKFDRSDGMTGRMYEQICGERGISEDLQTEQSQVLHEWDATAKGVTADCDVFMLPEKNRLFMTCSRKAREDETGDKYNTVFEILCADTGNWQELFRIYGRRPLKLSDDRKILLFLSQDQKAVVAADVSDGTILQTMSCDDLVKSFCMHPDGEHCFARTEKELLKFELSSGDCIQKSDLGKYALIVPRDLPGQRFSDDGKYLYEAGELFLKYNAETLNVVRAARLGAGACIFRDARKLYTTERDGFFSSTPDVYNGKYFSDRYNYDKRKKEKLPEIWPLAKKRIRQADVKWGKIRWLSADESRMLVCDEGWVKLYDTGSLRCLCTWFVEDKKILAASADENFSKVACGYTDCAVQVYCGREPEKEAPWELSVVESFAQVSKKQEQINQLATQIEEAIAAGNLQQAVSFLHEAEGMEGDVRSARIRDLRHTLSGKIESETIESVYEAGFVETTAWGNHGIHSIAVSPKERSFASGLSGNPVELQIWNDDLTEKSKIEIWERRGYSHSMQFSKNGRYLVAGIREEDGNTSYIAFWDLQNSNQEKVIKNLPYALKHIALSPNGKFVLAGGDNGFAAVYNVETRLCKKVMEESEDDIIGVCFLKNGEWACLADSAGKCRIYDTQTYACIKTMEVDEMYMNSMAVHPCEENVYFNASDQGVVSVWDMNLSHEIGRFDTEQRNELFMAIEPKGRVMATTGWDNDGVIKIWSMKDYSLLASLKSKETNIHYLAFSADGCSLYASSNDNINIWEVRWVLEEK